MMMQGSFGWFGVLFLLGGTLQAGNFNLSLKRLRGDVDKALQGAVQPVKTVIEKLEEAAKNNIDNSKVLNIVKKDGVSLVKGLRNPVLEAELERLFEQIKHNCFWCKQDALTLALLDLGDRGYDLLIQTITGTYPHSSMPFIFFMNDLIKEQEKITKAVERLKDARNNGIEVQFIDQEILDFYQTIIDFLMRFVNDMVCGKQFRQSSDIQTEGTCAPDINGDNQSTCQ